MRIVAEVTIHGRTFYLVSAGGPDNELQWMEHYLIVQQASALETALGLLLEETRRKLIRVSCDKDLSRDCFECDRVDCEFYWGVELQRVEHAESESDVMPPKKQIKAAIKKGTNPYAVAQSMVNKGKISPAKKERAVKSITKSVLKGKGKGKSCGK